MSGTYQNITFLKYMSSIQQSYSTFLYLYNINTKELNETNFN